MNDLVRAIRDKLSAPGGAYDASKAVHVIRAAMDVARGRRGVSADDVLDALEYVAKGPDGVPGTADDLIPAPALALLRTLLQSGAAADVVEWTWKHRPAWCCV